MLTGLADIADMLAALGVIGSLLFVAFEVRRNTAESKLASWERNIDRFNAQWSRPNSAELSEVIARERADYGGLTPAKKLMFGGFHNELCLAYESMLVLGQNHPQGETLMHIPRRSLSHYFGFPGARMVERLQERPGFLAADRSGDRGCDPRLGRAGMTPAPPVILSPRSGRRTFRLRCASARQADRSPRRSSKRA